VNDDRERSLVAASLVAALTSEVIAGARAA
jgi:hypothetical protein